MKDLFKRVSGIHNSIVNDVPQLKRGQVWCHVCGKTKKVDPVHCLKYGWDKCCGQTMSVDSPEERKAIHIKDGAE